MKTALLVRLDKIGDLVLTLPADQQAALANYQSTWLVARGMGFVPKNAIPAREYFEIQKEFGVIQWMFLWNLLRKLRPDVIVSFQAPWWIHFAFFLFGVRKRVGVLSKWHAFLFLNAGVRQKRSQSTNNELEYNHQLVHQGLGDTQPISYTYLRLNAPEISLPTSLALPTNYVVVHPGMAGSARNWPTEKYIQLLEEFSKRKIKTIITGTKPDSVYVEPLKAKLQQNSSILWWNEKLNIDQLLFVLSKAQHVIAPSTGVLHLAASLGISVTGIYSPVQVQHAKRWGPKGLSTKTVSPQVDCPGIFSCLGKKCPAFDCMALVTAEEILQTIT